MPRSKGPKPAKTLGPSVPLTDDNPMRVHTYPGQFSWAVSSRTTCRECTRFVDYGYYAGGALKPGHCELSARHLPPPPVRFPHHAKSCKAFVRHLGAPTAFKQK